MWGLIMRNKNKIWIILFIVLGSLYVVIDAFEIASVYKQVLSSVITFTGVFALWYQFKKEKDITEAGFILDLNNTFVHDQGIKDIYSKLRKNINNDERYLGEEDRKYVVDYLTFFETLYILYKKEVFKIDEINDMFAYRFFLGVNNSEVRRLELDENGDFFRALYDFYIPWAEFRRKNNFEIINSHLDFEKYYLKLHIPRLVDVKIIDDKVKVKLYNKLDDKKVWFEVDSILKECNSEFIPKLSTRGFHGKILPESKQNKDKFAYMTELRNQMILTIEVDEKIVGFTSFYHNYQTDEFEKIDTSNYIMTVCVRKDYRRNGYASIMYRYLINNLPEDYQMDYLSTRTWSTNSSHIGLLDNLGFSVDNILKNHRGEGLDTNYYYLKTYNSCTSRN